MRSPASIGIPITLSILCGFGVGLLANHLSPPSQEASLVLSSLSKNGPPGSMTATERAEAAQNHDTEGVTLSGISVDTDFAALSYDEQKSILERLSGKYGKGRDYQRIFGTDYPPGVWLWLSKAIRNISADQAARLLGFPPDDEGDDRVSMDPLLFTTIASRLAAIDPERALELGKKADDFQILVPALEAIARQDGAKALRIALDLGKVGLLPDCEQLSLVRGDFQKMVAVLSEKSSAFLASPSQWNQSSQLGRFLGPVLAEGVLASPETALAQVHEFSSLLEKLAPKDGALQGREQFGELGPLKSIVQNALLVLHSQSSRVASAFFNGLGENERALGMYAYEALAVLDRGGVDAAISFAETQSSERGIGMSAVQIWRRLAEMDRSAALSWIETLPEGRFREGVLHAVRHTGAMRANDLSAKTDIGTGMSIPSKAIQLDYFTNILTNPLELYGTFFPKREFVESLPLSEADKNEILRRVAPIK
jgi:hypothetical protein